MVKNGIYIKAIQFGATFNKASGSYYDYVAEFYTTNKDIHEAVRKELVSKGYKKISNSKNGLTSVFVNDRHVVRVQKVW